MAGRAQGGDLDDLKKRNRRRDHRFRVSRGVVRAKSEHSRVSRELRTDTLWLLCPSLEPVYRSRKLSADQCGLGGVEMMRTALAATAAVSFAVLIAAGATLRNMHSDVPQPSIPSDLDARPTSTKKSDRLQLPALPPLAMPNAQANAYRSSPRRPNSFRWGRKTISGRPRLSIIGPRRSLGAADVAINE